MISSMTVVIPAKAGIQKFDRHKSSVGSLDARYKHSGMTEVTQS
jgi:hypothetical protein